MSHTASFLLPLSKETLEERSLECERLGRLVAGLTGKVQTQSGEFSNLQNKVFPFILKRKETGRKTKERRERKERRQGKER